MDLKGSPQSKLDEMCVLLSGRAIEKLSKLDFTGSSIDLKRAQEIAHNLVIEERFSDKVCSLDTREDRHEMEKLMQQQLVRALEFLKKDSQNLVTKFQEILLCQDYVTEEEIETIKNLK